ncbi:hypothetical protein J437_LFUL008708 [Ladona fulva]|uniref:Uncharacterized protein n=1 Tax=Ladona fulva TaxID=123851 RepID=A0A8K0NZC0_LADFU|nr:hypothetical protein J437_LFUL008708 [Ladona fulva]
MEDTAKMDDNVESVMVKFDVDTIAENLNKIPTPLENDELRSEDPDGLDNIENASTECDNIEEIFTNEENQETLCSKKEMFPNSQREVRMVPNFGDVMETFPDFDNHGSTTSDQDKDILSNVKQDLILLSEPQSSEDMSLKSEESKESRICKFQPEFVSSSEEGKLDFSKMECPYTWEECKSKNTEMDWIGFLLCKLSKPSSNCWRLFNLELLLACMYGYEKNYSKALETLKSCKKNLEVNADDAFFSNMMDGLYHLIYAAKCHTHLLSGKMDEAFEISSALLPAKELGSASQGAIWASKAYILCMFGDDEKKKASECIEKAIQLDPDDGTRRGSWYYLAGKIYTKIRLIDPRNKLPGKEEMDMYQKAVDKNPFPNHVVVLACFSGEAARGFKARCAFNWKKADSYYRISMGMIRKACTESELSLKDAVSKLLLWF